MINDIIRRRLIQNDNEYISDGLYLYLDAEDFNGGSHWIDRARGVVFDNFGVEKIDNYAYFAGTQYLRSLADGVLYVNGTLEIVFQADFNLSNRVLYRADYNVENWCFGWNTYGGATGSLWLKDRRWYNAMTSVYDADTFRMKHTFSATYDYIYQDLYDMARVQQGSNFDSHKTSMTWIGQRGNNSQFFIGRLYCIRLYTRRLSIQEILHNQQIDIKKYNL